MTDTPRPDEIQDFHLKDTAGILRHLLQLDSSLRALYVPQGFQDWRIIDAGTPPLVIPGDPPPERVRFKFLTAGLVAITDTGAIYPITTFLNLGDTPSSYGGQALRLVRVNAAETALEFSVRPVIPYQMGYQGKIKITSEVGTNLVGSATTLITFSARRAVPGSGGTTTIELAVDGVLTGNTLSWVPADLAWALKTVVISSPVAANARVSFDITAAETGNPRDIIAMVSD